MPGESVIDFDVLVASVVTAFTIASLETLIVMMASAVVTMTVTMTMMIVGVAMMV